MARRYGRVAIFVAVTAGLATAGYAAREELGLLRATEAVQDTVERPAQPVRVTPVTFVEVATPDLYTGTIRPRQETPLGFRLAGQVTERLVDVGDRVKKGQVVARLDETDARLQVEAAEAELSAARTDLARATADADRSRALFAKGHVSRAALDRAQSGEAEARARADRAARQRDLAGNALGYTSLRAEAEGIVTAALAEVGQVVAAGQPILHLAEEGARDVVFALPEHRRDTLLAAEASAEIWGAEGTLYPLALRDISPDVDPVGRTYRVRMQLAVSEKAAAFGRTVTVRLAPAETAATVRLPLAAVTNAGTGAFVWRVTPDTARVEPVPVEIVALDARTARIRAPLSEGDLVVSLGAQRIDPDRPVRIVETASTPES